MKVKYIQCKHIERLPNMGEIVLFDKAKCYRNKVDLKSYFIVVLSFSAN